MKKLIFLFFVLSLLGCEIEPAEPSIIGSWEIYDSYYKDMIGMQYFFEDNIGRWEMPGVYSEGFHWWIEGDMLYMSSDQSVRSKGIQYSISSTGMRWVNESNKETLLKRL